MIYWEDYFKSKSHMFAYALLDLDGKVKQDILEITRMQYIDKNAADSWYKKAMGIIHTGPIDVLIIKMCEVRIEEIYAGMIGREVALRVSECKCTSTGIKFKIKDKSNHGDVSIGLF